MRFFLGPDLAGDEELLALVHGQGVATGIAGAVVFGRLVVEGVAVVAGAAVGGAGNVVDAAIVVAGVVEAKMVGLCSVAGDMAVTASFSLPLVSAPAASRRFLGRPATPNAP